VAGLPVRVDPPCLLNFLRLKSRSQVIPFDLLGLVTGVYPSSEEMGREPTSHICMPPRNWSRLLLLIGQGINGWSVAGVPSKSNWFESMLAPGGEAVLSKQNHHDGKEHRRIATA